MGLKEPKVTEQLGKKRSDRWTELRGEDSTIQIQGRPGKNSRSKGSEVGGGLWGQISQGVGVWEGAVTDEVGNEPGAPWLWREGVGLSCDEYQSPLSENPKWKCISFVVLGLGSKIISTWKTFYIPGESSTFLIHSELTWKEFQVTTILFPSLLALCVWRGRRCCF